MKFFKLILLMTIISSIFFVSCNDDEVSSFIVEDEISGFKPSPFDPGLFEEVKIPVIDLSLFNQEIDSVIPRNGCAEYIAATNRFIEIERNCEYDEAYCSYLYVFRGLSRWIYQYDCIPETFCENCEGYIVTANELKQELIDAGLHPLYISDIEQLIERLELLCSWC